MFGAKYVESLESGVIGALLIPTGMILLYAAAAAIDQLAGTSVSQQGQDSPIFWIWALAIVPLTVALAGIISFRLASKYEPGLVRRSIFSAISGIIAVVWRRASVHFRQPRSSRPRTSLRGSGIDHHISSAPQLRFLPTRSHYRPWHFTSSSRSYAA